MVETVSFKTLSHISKCIPYAQHDYFNEKIEIPLSNRIKCFFYKIFYTFTDGTWHNEKEALDILENFKKKKLTLEDGSGYQILENIFNKIKEANPEDTPLHYSDLGLAYLVENPNEIEKPEAITQEYFNTLIKKTQLINDYFNNKNDVAFFINSFLKCDDIKKSFDLFKIIQPVNLWQLGDENINKVLCTHFLRGVAASVETNGAEQTVSLLNQNFYKFKEKSLISERSELIKATFPE